MRHNIFARIATALAVAGCGASGTPSTDGGATGSASGVTITIASAIQVTNVLAGNVDDVVTFTLANAGIAPAPLMPMLFSVETSSGIDYIGTTGYVNGCDGSAAVTSGHSVSCAIGFAVPTGTVATAFFYTTPDGTAVQVRLNPTCTLCNGLCADTQNDPRNCGGCNSPKSGGCGETVACVAGVLTQGCGDCSRCAISDNACVIGPQGQTCFDTGAELPGAHTLDWYADGSSVLTSGNAACKQVPGTTCKSVVALYGSRASALYVNEDHGAFAVDCDQVPPTSQVVDGASTPLTRVAYVCL